MVCSTPGFPVHHQLPELAETHVHLISDAIQPSHPLLSPSPAFSLSQHQGIFQWVSSLHLEHLGLQMNSSLYTHRTQGTRLSWSSPFYLAVAPADSRSICPTGLNLHTLGASSDRQTFLNTVRFGVEKQLPLLPMLFSISARVHVFKKKCSFL